MKICGECIYKKNENLHVLHENDLNNPPNPQSVELLLFKLPLMMNIIVCYCLKILGKERKQLGLLARKKDVFKLWSNQDLLPFVTCAERGVESMYRNELFSGICKY